MSRDALRTSKSANVTVLSVLAALVLILGFAAWWMATFERVIKVQTLPPRGEAAYNPLYALKLALVADGQPTNARQRLELDENPLGAHDTLLLYGDPATLRAQERSELLDWVARGGHLILRTPPLRDDLDADDAPIFGELGIVLDGIGEDDDPISECMGLRVAREDDHVEFCYARRFAFAEDGPDILLSWDDEASETSVFARLAHGRGTVDVLADLDFLNNNQLEDGPHYALARQLFQPNRGEGGTAHLIYSADVPSLFRLMMRYGWMIATPLLLALMLWLWLRTERFGPLQPSPAAERRSLLEHVQAAGDHLYRYGRSAVLYDAVFDAFLRRLRRRDPYAAALDGALRVEAIARRTGMSTAEIEDALRYPRPRDPRDFVYRIAKLLHLRHRL